MGKLIASVTETFNANDYERFWNLISEDALKTHEFYALLEKAAENRSLPNLMTEAYKNYLAKKDTPKAEARNDLEQALVDRGISIRHIPGVLIPEEPNKTGDKRAVDHEDQKSSRDEKTEYTHKLLHFVDALIKEKGNIIDDVIIGDKPTNKRAPHYYIVTLKDNNTWFAIADGHLDYVSRDDLEPISGVTTKQLQGHKKTYRTCAFHPDFVSTWTASLIRFGFESIEILGTQNKGRKSWSDTGVSLLFALKSFVESERRLPKHTDKIVSDDPKINNHPYRNAVTRCRKNTVTGLEQANGINDLFFEACLNHSGLRDSVDASYWTQRQTGTGKTGAEFEQEYLERRAA